MSRPPADLGRALRLRSALLWVSLALNVFTAGVITSHLLHRPPPPPEMGLLSERVVRTLPDADAARVQAILDRERPRFRTSRERMDAARASLSSAIAREPYDAALVSQRLSEFRQRWQEMSDRFAETLLPVLADLSPEGRTKLVSMADRPQPRHRPGPPP